MNYRTLGKTGLKVSELGYGTWQFANDEDCWVGASRSESEQALLTAIDQGVNFIDTARSYGDGLAEKWIGEIIKYRPSTDLIICSKLLPKNLQWPARKGIDINEVFPTEHIIQQVEESLKDLDREYLDIMLFHVWQDDWANEDDWKQTIQMLTKQGKVKHWGISTNNFESTNCIKACDTGLISVIETVFNLFYQEPITSLFPYAKTNNLGLIARVPLDEGGLSGTIDSNTKFQPGDFRRDYFTPDRLQELDKRLKLLEPLITNDITNLPDLALRFILNFNEVSTVIPGMRKSKHVISNIASATKPKLNQELITKLLQHAWNRNFYPKNPWET